MEEAGGGVAGRAAVVRGYKEKQRYVFPGDRRARYDRGGKGGEAEGGGGRGARLYIRRVEGRKGVEREGGRERRATKN